MISWRSQCTFISEISQHKQNKQNKSEKGQISQMKPVIRTDTRLYKTETHWNILVEFLLCPKKCVASSENLTFYNAAHGLV